jgi:progressive ankylosis protein
MPRFLWTIDLMRQRDIFIFWLPLFASWLLMTAEGPIVTAAINRLPDEVIMLAAQGIVVSLAITIESPIINLLATATALVRDDQSFRVVRRFTIHWAIALTAVSVAVAFTPLFDLIVFRWLNTPPEIGRWVRPGMQIMTLWTAAIAWRRFLQGALIHFGYTRVVAWGTAVRLVASGGAAVGLALWSDWPGVAIGATALMAGVIAEAAYATVAVRPLRRNELAPGSVDAADPAGSGEAPLRYGELFWFHLPLAGTALLTLLAQPLVTLSLARLDNPTLSLAAWPLTFQVVLMARAAAMALPEAVIALTRGPETYGPIRRFSLTLAGLSVVSMVLLALTPLLTFYLFQLQDADPDVAGLAAYGTRLFLLYPALFVLVSWLRGLLIKSRATRAVNLGMGINLLLTGVVLALGVAMRWDGITSAALALYLAIIAELLYLAWRVRARLGIRLWADPRPRWLRPAVAEE